MVYKRQGGGAEEPQRGRRRDEVDWLLLESVVRHPDDLVPFVSRQTGLSRQALNKRVAALVAEGTLEATGATRARTYRWRPVVRVAVTPDLTEDSIWKHHLAPRLVDVAPNVREILQFGATEMINNVIDHSDGSELIVFLRPLESEVELQVQDDGEGLIQKLVRECSFEDARQALLELSKGKLTTDPTRHSGEGIFFTSRMCDKFMIWSDNTCLMRIEGQGFDLTEVAEPRPGTTVRMIVQRDTERTTREVFEQYASEASDYGFTSTSISVNLARDAGDALLSRSQARRLLARLDEFEEVHLDFRNVESIGPAFADEIFRIFVREHPRVRLTWGNASDQVEKMIGKAERARMAEEGSEP